MRSVRCLALLFALILSIPSNLHAQSSSDQKEITHHTLSMAEITHVMQATAAVNQAVKADPALRKKDDNSDGQQSLDQMSAKIGSSPKIVAILATYSLTPRTYALGLMSLFQTSFAVAAIDSGAKESELVSTGAANAANIALIRAHKAEIDEMGKKYPMQSE